MRKAYFSIMVLTSLLSVEPLFIDSVELFHNLRTDRLSYYFEVWKERMKVVVVLRTLLFSLLAHG